MPRKKKTGIYIHIPFCVRKCNYCAFLSMPSTAEERQRYVDALIKEIELRRDEAAVNTAASECSFSDVDMDAEITEGKAVADGAAAKGETVGGIVGCEVAECDSIYFAERKLPAFLPRDAVECDSIYFGGGTSSLLEPVQIAQIMDALRCNYNIAPNAEVTLEVNPATLGDGHCDVGVAGGARCSGSGSCGYERVLGYKNADINRISMGVQSLNDDILRRLGRIHSANQVYEDFALLRRAGFDNIGLDLMFGIPGTTLADVVKDARAVAERLRPEHVSTYSLQLETGTPFFEQFEAGELTEVPDELDREMYSSIIDILTAAGYEHYEISNFALVDSDSNSSLENIELVEESYLKYRSRYNSKYWNMSYYLGFGLGASSFVYRTSLLNNSSTAQRNDESSQINGHGVYESTQLTDFCKHGVRCTNISQMNEYIAAVNAGHKPFAETHINTWEDSLSEAIFTGLRRREGVRYAELADVSEGRITDRLSFESFFAAELSNIDSFRKSGDLIVTDEGVRITRKGIDISNRIMALFV